MILKNAAIFWALVKINLKRLFEYRALFFVECFTMVLWSLAYILLIEVIFLNTPTLAGWTKSQALLILAFYYSFMTTAEIFFIDNFERFALNLRRGNLDLALTKPVSSRLLVFFQYMQFQDTSHYVMTIMLFIYAIRDLPQPIDPLFFLGGLLMVIPAAILNFCMHSVAATIAFWVERSDTLNTLMWNFRQTAKYPRQIYQGFFQQLFTFLIPFAVLSTVPAETAMKIPQPWYIFLLIALTLVFFYVSRWFWNKGLKKYSSAG